MESGFFKRPHLPKEAPDVPTELYVKETIWSHWQGSAAEVERLASRAEAEIRRQFVSWDEPRWWDFEREWRKTSSLPYRQHSVTVSAVLMTKFFEGLSVGPNLADEINARRSAVTRVDIDVAAMWRLWIATGSGMTGIVEEAKIHDRSNPGSRDVVPGRDIQRTLRRRNSRLVRAARRLRSWLGSGSSDAPVREVQMSWGTSGGPPVRIELIFQNEIPAACLRVTASTAAGCDAFHRDMVSHVRAGARPRAWDKGQGNEAGMLVGAAIPAPLLFTAVIGPWTTLLAQTGLAACGWVLGGVLQRWSMPPLELLEVWERTRWQQVKTVAWQLLSLALAVVGVILAVKG